MKDDLELSGSPSAAAGGSEAAVGVIGDIMRDAREALKVLEITGVMLEAGPMPKVGALLLRVVKVISVELAPESPESAGDPPDDLRAAHSEADGLLVWLAEWIERRIAEAREEEAAAKRESHRDDEMYWVGQRGALDDLEKEMDRRTTTLYELNSHHH